MAFILWLRRTVGCFRLAPAWRRAGAKALARKQLVHSPSQMGCIAPASFTHTHTTWQGSANGLHCACEFYTHTPVNEGGPDNFLMKPKRWRAIRARAAIPDADRPAEACREP